MLLYALITVLVAVNLVLAAGLVTARTELFKLESDLLSFLEDKKKTYTCVTCSEETSSPTPTTHSPICPTCYSDLKEMF